MKRFKSTHEVYSLKNDQGMKNLDNLLTPSGKVVSLFQIEGDKDESKGVIDLMIKDYEKITDNLSLLRREDVEINKKIYRTYLISEKKSESYICQMVFENKDKLYSLIFKLEKGEEDFKSSATFKEVVKFLEGRS